MALASEAYLAELAEEFLTGQLRIGWKNLATSDLSGETTWIDPSLGEPGVEVEMSYRRLENSIEIEVVAYQPNDNGKSTLSVRRVGIVRSDQ
jgi:hypothetical protein